MQRLARLAIAAVLSGLTMTGAARADPPPNYVRLFGGVLVLPPVPANSPFESQGGYIDYELIAGLGYRLGAAIGRDMGPLVSVETELSFARAPFVAAIIPEEGTLDLTNVDRSIGILSLTGNLVVGPTLGPLRPYVAFGAGAARVHLDLGLDVVDDHDVAWTVQAMAGIDVALSEALSIGGRYRFQVVGPTTYASAFSGDPFYLRTFTAHSFEASVLFRF
ncbi:MAG: outer membrane protein [Bauldia sp.]